MSDMRLFVFCKTCEEVNTFPSPDVARIGVLALRSTQHIPPFEGYRPNSLDGLR